MAENPDLHFGKLLWAVMKQDKEAYIEALETLTDAFATHGTLPQELDLNEADPRDKMPIYTAALWQIATLAVDDGLSDEDARQAIAAALCRTGHMEFSFKLAVKPPSDPA